AALCALCNAQPMLRALSKRVVGGEDAQSHEYPFAVYVSSPVSTNNTACAGAILTNQLIVTTAFCVYNPSTKSAVDPGGISIGYGNSDRGSQPQAKVKKIIIDSGYDPTTGIDNIALLQVDLATQISATVNRIPVYTGDVKSGDSLTIMGWGSVKPIAVASTNVLNHVNVTVGDDFSCKGPTLYQNSNGRAICTRNILTPGAAPCLGDYGGPLITYDRGIPKLVGLLSSFSTLDGTIDFCANNNTKAYYTHVNYYMSFLEQTTQLSANAFTGNEPLPPANVTVVSGSSGLSKGAIAGISVAGAIALILLCALAYVIRYALQKRQDARHEQRIYELGLQQLADELGGSYEPKASSAISAFHSSGVTPLEEPDLVSRASLVYRYIRNSAYSDMTEQPFSENIPRIAEVGTELTLDSLSKTHRHTDGSPKVMDFLRPDRDGKIADYYRHLLSYELADGEDSADLISL
ncbi:hypothetical protein LPJ61_001836, partial [Coemansia biformis]